MGQAVGDQDEEHTDTESLDSAGRGGFPNSHQHQSASDTQTGQQTSGNKQSNAQALSAWASYFRRVWTDSTPQEHLTLVLTFVIATSTFFYTIFAGWQLYEIHSSSADTHALAVAAKNQAIAATLQANTLDKTLESSQRPWIAVDASPGGPLTINQYGMIARVKVHFANVGHSPAIQVRITGKLGDFFGGSSKSLLPNPYTMRKQICDALAKEADPYQKVLFPDGDSNIIFGVVMQPDEVAKAAIEDGTIHPILIGCVDYQYSFEIGQHHQTRFAYSISAKGRELRPASGEIPKSAVEISSDPYGIQAY